VALLAVADDGLRLHTPNTVARYWHAIGKPQRARQPTNKASPASATAKASFLHDVRD